MGFGPKRRASMSILGNQYPALKRLGSGNLERMPRALKHVNRTAVTVSVQYLSSEVQVNAEGLHMHLEDPVPAHKKLRSEEVQTASMEGLAPARRKGLEKAVRK
jgi:hypothetical protein